MLDILLSLFCMTPAWLCVLGAGAWAVRRAPRRAAWFLGVGLVGLLANLGELGLIASLLLEVQDASVWGSNKYMAGWLLGVPMGVQVLAVTALGARVARVRS